jgi:hypothetical protein
MHWNYKHLFPYADFVELRTSENVGNCIQQVYSNIDYTPVSLF